MTPQQEQSPNYHIAIAYELAVSRALGLHENAATIKRNLTHPHMTITSKLLACPVDVCDYHAQHGSLAGVPLADIGETGLVDLDILLTRGVDGLVRHLVRDERTTYTHLQRVTNPTSRGRRVEACPPCDQSPGPSWDLACRYLEEQ